MCDGSIVLIKWTVKGERIEVPGILIRSYLDNGWWYVADIECGDRWTERVTVREDRIRLM